MVERAVLQSAVTGEAAQRVSKTLRLCRVTI